MNSSGAQPKSSARNEVAASSSTGHVRHGARRRIGDHFHPPGEIIPCDTFQLAPQMGEEKMREQVWVLCHDYLNGAWKKIRPEDMVWRPMSGGLSNYLYYCSLPPEAAPAKTAEDDILSPVENGPKRNPEPKETLVRVYGQVQQGEELDVQSLVTESVIFTVLSERRLGPKLYGIFPGGRLEEYIPCPSLQTWELFDPEISRKIAEKMAKMHALQLPISKEPTWMWETMGKWLNTVEHDLFELTKCPAAPAFPNASSDVNEKFFQLIKGINFREELLWLQKTLEIVRSPVVFGHNDLQEGNILVQRREDRSIARLVIIDFEYCAYNYRGFDLANHFCEWMFNYKVDHPPYFISDPENYPNMSQRLYFLRHYLSSLSTEQYVRSSPSGTSLKGAEIEEERIDGGCTVEESELQKLLDEVDVFQLASHMFWTLWSCVNAMSSSIPFGYWEYAACRAKAYLDHKRQIEARLERGELLSVSPGTPCIPCSKDSDQLKSDAQLSVSELAAALGSSHASS